MVYREQAQRPTLWVLSVLLVSAGCGQTNEDLHPEGKQYLAQSDYHRSLALGELGKHVESQEEMAKAIRLEPDRSSKNGQAVSRTNAGDQPMVGPQLFSSDEHHGRDARILLQDSEIARAVGEMDEANRALDGAIEQLLLAIAQNPDNAQTHYWLGLAYLRKGQHKNARESLKKAINLDSNSFGAYLELAKLLYEDGGAQDYAVAAEFFRRATLIHRRSAEAHYLRAKACLADYKRGIAFTVPELGETPPETQLDEAIGEFLEAARLDANYTDRIAADLAEAQRVKAQACATRGRWQQAIDAMTTALVHQPDQPRNFLLRAAYHAKAGRTVEATKDYEKAFSQGLTPPQILTLPEIAKNMILRKAHEDLHGLQLDAALDKAKIAAQMKTYFDHAARDLEKLAVGLPESLSSLYVNIGCRYLQAKEYKRAVEQFNEALKWDDKNAHAYWNRGVAISRRNRPDLWEDEEWKFEGWAPFGKLPKGWTPKDWEASDWKRATEARRELVWRKAWEKKWTAAWKEAWHADIVEAAKLSLKYRIKLNELNGRDHRSIARQ